MTRTPVWNEVVMTEYQFHWLTAARESRRSQTVTLEAQTPRHGAALALLYFKEHGWDILTPLAHVDVTEQSGRKHTLLVDEVLEWLHDPRQTAFVQDEHLGGLFAP
jgi:hypothetical protein